MLWLKTPSLKFREHHLFISSFYNHFSDIVPREQSQKCFGHFFKTFHNSFLGFDFSFIYPLCHLSNAFVPTVCPSWNNEAFHLKLLELKSVKFKYSLKKPLKFNDISKFYLKLLSCTKKNWRFRHILWPFHNMILVKKDSSDFKDFHQASNIKLENWISVCLLKVHVLLEGRKIFKKSHTFHLTD